MSLKYRIAATIFVLEALVMGVVLTRTISQFDEATKSHLADAEDVVLDLLTGMGRTVLLTQEYAGMQPYLQQVSEDSRVLRAMLADHRGLVVASLDATDLGAPLPAITAADGSRFWRTASISNSTGNLGTVAVEFSNAPLREASARIRSQAIAIAITGMSLIALAGIATGVFLTRKLDRVSHAAQDLAVGNLEARSGVQGSDEIGQLGQTFDLMASALESDRKRIRSAEDALEKRVEHYRSLVDNAPISIHEVSLDGRLLSINEAGRRMMSASAGVEPGTAFIDLVDGECHRAVREALDRALGGSPAQFEFTRTVDEATRTFRSGFHPIRDERGRVTQLLGLAEDITERRRAEDALQASESRLRQAQKMEAIGLLAGGVAHDFNNILTVVTGYADLLLSLDDFPHRERVEEISNAAERAASLTHQLLAFGRRQVLQPRVMDLNAAVNEMRKMLCRLIGEDIELVTETDPGIGNVRADPGQIHQVILNLAVNSRDAMPNGGRFSLSTRNVEVSENDARRHEGLRPGPYVALVANDNGIGMTEEVASHIFEPFFTTREGGTGLGLSTVYGIVKQSEGYIRVSSESGKGTSVEILLPRVSSRVGESRQTPPSTREGDGTILLVEDDAAVRALVRDVLVGHGYDVLEAADGEAALELLEERHGSVDAMMTDLVMPNMGGSELATAVASRHPHVRILFTTGYAGSDRAVLHGAHVLKKPFTPRSLLQKVGEVLDGAESPPPERDGGVLESPRFAPSAAAAASHRNGPRRPPIDSG